MRGVAWVAGALRVYDLDSDGEDACGVAGTSMGMGSSDSRATKSREKIRRRIMRRRKCWKEPDR